MRANKPAVSVLTDEDIHRLGALVDYLAGLESLANPDHTAGTSVTLLKEQFQALLKPASVAASNLYCRLCASSDGRDPEEVGSVDWTMLGEERLR